MHTEPRVGTFRPKHPETCLWNPAGINRAAKIVADHLAGKPSCGHKPRLLNHDELLAEAAEGKGNGIVWEEDGVKLRAQLWSPSPYVRSYWMKVWEGSAHFPGEMRLAFTVTREDGATGLQMDGKRYNAQGRDRIHEDGSTCYGYVAPNGCSGCNADRARKLIGKPVKIVIDGDESYGRTVRWGTLREITPDRVAVFDDLHDSSGIGEYSPTDKRHSGNGVRFALADIHELVAA